MKIIVISYPVKYQDEHIIINELFRLGLEIFHLRKPLYSAEDLSSLLDMIDTKYHNRIVIHTHYTLNYKLKGIHFNSTSRNIIKKYKDYPIHKSLSCHSFKEIEEYANIMNYSFISPVFDSISKKDYKANIDLKDFKECAKTNKIVALGGIKDSNVKDLKEMNLYGIALLGYIWNSDKPIEAFKRIQKCI